MHKGSLNTTDTAACMKSCFLTIITNTALSKSGTTKKLLKILSARVGPNYFYNETIQREFSKKLHRPNAICLKYRQTTHGFDTLHKTFYVAPPTSTVYIHTTYPTTFTIKKKQINKPAPTLPYKIENFLLDWNSSPSRAEDILD